jgi:hypothetical protein
MSQRMRRGSRRWRTERAVIRHALGKTGGKRERGGRAHPTERLLTMKRPETAFPTETRVEEYEKWCARGARRFRQCAR